MSGRPIPVVMSWSGGKDSALALQLLLQSDKYTVAGLVTTVTCGYDRISMHGVRQQLLQQQAQALDLPLYTVPISRNASNREYEGKWAEVLSRFKDWGIQHVAFGDLYLEDIRAYRERQMNSMMMQATFPLWHRDTTDTAHEVIQRGYGAVICCVDIHHLSYELVGSIYNDDFLAGLPKGVDPCGENGEFHSFVFDGPIFTRRVIWLKGRAVVRNGHFGYCDLLPSGNSVNPTKC